MELIGILYKGSPNESKTKLFNYVITNSMSCLNDPSSIISICNCFSYMFDEVTIMSKEIIIETLKSIRNKNTYVYIDDSILLTLEGFISRSIV